MEIYVLTTIIIILFGCLGSLSELLRRISILVSCSLLGVIYAFRSLYCGDDTLAYSYLFDQIGSYSFYDLLSSPYEILYTFLNWSIFEFGGSYYNLMSIEAIILMGALSYFLFKKSRYPWLGILLFMGLGCFHQSMNVSRQFLAIALVLFSFVFIDEKKPVKFTLLVFIASMIHTSAIVALLLYPITRLNIHGKEWAFVLFAALVILFKDSIAYAFLLFLSPGYQIVSAQTEGLTLLAVWWGLMMGLCFISIKYNNPDVQFTFKLVFLAILFQTFVGNIPVVGRLSYYFIVPFYLLFPNTIRNFSSLNMRAFFVLILSGLIVLFYFGFYLQGGASNTVPYTFQ